MSERIYIKNVKDARNNIGKKVYWNDVGSRYIFLRSGIIEEVSGKNILIDGNWLWRSNLKCLRNFKE